MRWRYEKWICDFIVLLPENQDYYQGLIKLFPKWAEKNKAMPMSETRLDLVLKAKG